MKKLALLLILLLAAAGCRHLGHQVRGSGVRQKQQRAVASFNAISTSGAFEIEVVSQKTQSLEIEADDNILPLVTTDVSSGVLNIGNSKSYSVSQPIRLIISVPDLKELSASGAGRVQVSGLKNDRFEININGAPSINVSGETNEVNIDSNGAGKIDTHKLRADRAIIDSKGVSRIEVYAGKQLDVSVSGPSRVTYQGNPVVNKTVNGPGSVEKKESEGS